MLLPVLYVDFEGVKPDSDRKDLNPVGREFSRSLVWMMSTLVLPRGFGSIGGIMQGTNQC